MQIVQGPLLTMPHRYFWENAMSGSGPKPQPK